MKMQIMSFCDSELTDVGVKAVVPKGGFYIFPNFEVLRETLTAQGIHTCEQMVEKLFRETAVSVRRLLTSCSGILHFLSVGLPFYILPLLIVIFCLFTPSPSFSCSFHHIFIFPLRYPPPYYIFHTHPRISLYFSLLLYRIYF